jgi:4-amino-4-deoxy-L-arabinose transferase-like glycosyltransferase
MRKVVPLLAVFVLALAVRLVYLAGIEAYPKFELIRNRLDDQVVFDAWAKSIVAGERFDYSTTGHEFARWAALDPGVYPQAPLYPFFVAGLYEVFGFRYDAVRAVQMVLGAAACVLLTLLARRFLAPWTAVACGLGLAFFGPMVFYEGTFLRAGVFTFVAVAGLYLLVRSAAGTAARGGDGWALAAGVALSAGVLLRPNYLLFAVLALAWLSRSRPRRTLALAAAGLLLPLLPVVAANSVRSGGLRFLSSNGPYIFFLGNVHDAPGTTAGVSPSYLELLASRPPEEIDLVGEALRDVRRHPGAFLRLQVRKALYFFSPVEIPNNLSYAMARRTNPRLAAGFVPFWLLLPPALAGLLVSSASPRRHLLLYLFLAGYGVGTVAFYVLSRLRQPVVPVLLIFAGLAVEAWWRTLRRRRWTAATLAAAAMVAAAVLLRPGAALHRPADYQMAAAAYSSRGHELEDAGATADAERRYARAVALSPDHDEAVAALVRLGYRPPAAGPEIRALCEQARSAMDAGRERDAVRLLERAAALAPDAALPYHYLGNVLYLAGEQRRAMAAMEKAVERDPYSAVLRDNLARLRR